MTSVYIAVRYYVRRALWWLGLMEAEEFSSDVLCNAQAGFDTKGWLRCSLLWDHESPHEAWHNHKITDDEERDLLATWEKR